MLKFAKKYITCPPLTFNCQYPDIISGGTKFVLKDVSLKIKPDIGPPMKNVLFVS
jgi:uncharacterized protein (DUF2225 family)